MWSTVATRLLGAALLLACVPALGDGGPEAPSKSTSKPGASGRWHVLYSPARRARGTRPLSESAPLKSLSELELTGPEPGHPFVLGEFAVDGRWGIVDGAVARVEGTNAALLLGRAENFELEGLIEMGDVGGWFLLIGWDQGRGYSIINIGFRESPSPWFITEYRGAAAIADAHQQVARHTWRRQQALRLAIKDRQLNLSVGPVAVLKQQMLANYSAGDIILGVYDTRYGPRSVRIHSLRIRNLE